jgi:hypothetical protein
MCGLKGRWCDGMCHTRGRGRGRETHERTFSLLIWAANGAPQRASILSHDRPPPPAPQADGSAWFAGSLSCICVWVCFGDEAELSQENHTNRTFCASHAAPRPHREVGATPPLNRRTWSDPPSGAVALVKTDLDDARS